MKILYFSNISFTPNSYNGGGWIFSTIKEMQKAGNECAVCFLDEEDKKSIINSLICYSIKGHNGGSVYKKIMHRVKLLFGNNINVEKKTWPYYEKKFISIIADFKPDVIHIFGSEMQYGLIGSKTNIPVVLHIQGLINPYENALLPPSFSWENICKPFNLFSFLDLRISKRIWQMNSFREREILKRVNNYIGRTIWDERVIRCFNKDANYFYGSEILREDFYENSVRCAPSGLKIVSTISSPMYKGFDMILKTANVLRNYINVDFEWIVYGNVRPTIIEKLVGIRHNDVNVVLGGVVTGNKLKESLLNSTCYMHPSYIDNSPNSVCEAQILGVPVVSCNVGGVSSLIEENVTGFLVPSNDPYQAAFLICKLFKDQSLNKEIGQNSKKISYQRHDKSHICQQLLSVYKTLK